MNRNFVTILFLLGIALIAGCNSPRVTEYGRLVDNLRETGATVEEAGAAELPGAGEPIFSVTSKTLKVNGENVQVLEYAKEATAETEAKFVSSDGFTLTKPGGVTAMVDWIAPPHWYTKDRIIVLYVGKNQVIIDLLEDLLGKQFAGM